MSEPSANSLFERGRRPFLLRKLHSLTGVVPLGAFMVFHLWENSKALQGQTPFDDAVAQIGHIPYLPVVETAGILLPLAFHALYGVKLALESKPNVRHYTFSRNWMYTLQRGSGLLAFAFILFHLWEYWTQRVLGKLATEQFYPTLCANMSSTVKGVPVIALIYVFGLAAAVFHFANGLWGFCFSWGITVSRRSQRLGATVFGVLGLAIFIMGANTALYFATGSRFAWLAHSPGSGGARTCADVPMSGDVSGPQTRLSTP